jgi:hypothetical protein
MAQKEPKTSNVSLIAVAWFRPEEWSDLKRLCPDLQETYGDWLANAEAGIEALGSPLKEQVVKIILTVEELRNWQRATGRKVDSKARANLAIRRANKEHDTRH